MRLKPHSAGFTLIEVLVAIVLFIVGALGLSKMQVSTIRSATFNREATVATNLAQNAMEMLKNTNKTSFATLAAAAGGSPVAITSASVPGLATANVPGIAITWASSNVQGTAPDRNLIVTVTVTWRQQSLSLRTIRSET